MRHISLCLLTIFVFISAAAPLNYSASFTAFTAGKAGKTGNACYICVTEPGSSQLSGEVKTVSGSPVGNVDIILSGGGLKEPLKTISSPLGYYSFKDLNDGTYNIEFVPRRGNYARATYVVDVNGDTTHGFLAVTQD